MIKKSLLTAMVMLVAYHFLLPHLSRKFYQISGQQRGNYLRVQRYLYDIPDNTNVIVGSSMSMELNEKTLGPGYFKLSLPGGSILTALEIIRRSGKLPPVLLVETNNIEWDVDEPFLEDLFTPLLLQLRRYSMIFREEGRPSNFVVGIAEAVVRKTCLLHVASVDRGPAGQKSPAPSERLEGHLFEKVMDINHDIFQHATSQVLLAEHADRLGRVIDLLAAQGCKPIFFEMPIDSSLTDLPLPTADRKAVAARFPPDKYSWLHFARDHNYETVDGIHLVRPEADRLTQTVLEQVNTILEESKHIGPNFNTVANRPRAPHK